MMKRVLFNLFFLLPAITTVAQNVWIPRDSVNGPARSAVTGFSINGLGYAGLGLDHTEYKRSFYRYDPVNDDWDRVNSFGGDTGDGNERASAVSFVIGSVAYVGLGQGANPYFGDFWKYDPASDSWTQVADYGGSPRTQACAFSIDQFGYAGTGQSNSGLEKDFWKYDPSSNTWSPIADFGGTARRQAVGVSMGGQGYVGTGDDGTFTNDFWQYDAAADNWIQKANFAGPARYGATGFAIFPYVYLGTGYNNTLNYCADFWQYNYWNNTWTQVAAYSGGARANAFAFAIGNRGYVGCGYDGSLKDDFYEYFPLLTSAENFYENVQLKLFPNPAHEFLFVQLSGLTDIIAADIYSSDGKLVRSIPVNNYQQRYKINCNDLPAGNYFISVRGNTANLAVKKFVVRR